MLSPDEMTVDDLFYVTWVIILAVLLVALYICPAC
jgi:hypothetical protein